MDTLHYIGKVAKTHGIDGELQIACEPGLSKIILKKEVLFLNYEGMALPFFVHEIQMLNPGSFLVSFLDYDNIDQVKRFVSCKVYIDPADKDDIPELFDERVFIGYTFIDNKLGQIGVLEDVIFKQQNLFVINHEGCEILLPVVLEFITGVDHDAKELYFDLPEGMINEF